ncbi:MAG: choice-of-anchor Q domain-containing protein [Paludibacter sp.]|nr:choice-of-anchor Q domain-containing protein [Paludibacter sp.]MDD4198980.1 choice-of-anchor Q domain-containing protein [Paludibacter sp.]MDD4427819.1 choice-of-anchor Q domain-containing protein [Paludibacter sp.]
MKKLITLLLIVLISGITVHAANTYLIYKSAAGGTWTNTGEITNPVLVDLSTINAGGEASLNAWFADRSLAAPTMGGGVQFAAGDQTWIISGTYVLTDTLRLFEGVGLFGGFAGTESAITGREKGSNAWDFTNETILDGNATVMGIVGGSASVATVVDGLSLNNFKNTASALYGAGARLIGASTIMQNCIVRNCVTASTAATSSGGVVLNAGATINNCYIHTNSTSGYGAGVTITGDACTLSNSKIINNTATSFGGGVNLYAATSGVTVDNCDISNNTTTAKSGGGLLAFSTGVVNANPVTISNCTFTSNSASSTAGSGGAMYLNTKAGNTINVSNCSFTSNQSNVSKSTTNGGGAIWVGTGIYNIDACTFTNNVVSLSGGGAILIGSGAAVATISKSVFTGNESTAYYGGALMLTYPATVNNCLFYGNKASNVIYLGGGAGATVVNNTTFASNTNVAGTASLGIYISGTSGAFTNCLFYDSGTNPISGGTGTTISYCGFQNTVGQAYATANNCIKTISAASFADAANNDYHLSSGSAAIDAGTTIAAITTDLEGTARPQRSAYDMGAYEIGPTVAVPGTNDRLLNCYADGKNLVINGLESGEHIIVYSVTGARVYEQKATANSFRITLREGIYVVNIDGQNKKVIVR